MSIFHNKIRFRELYNSNLGLRIAEFDPVVGTSNSFLNMDSIVTENFSGSCDYDFGAKFNERLNINVSFIKDGNNISDDFTEHEVRETLKWLSGARKVSWLDLYRNNGEIDYSILGRFVDIKLQKMDCRIVGVHAVFKSVSPWAYSSIQTVSCDVDGTSNILITNYSDDLDSYVYPQVIFKNGAGNSLTIINKTIGEDLQIKNLLLNEKIVMDTNQIIYSDNAVKIFDNDFNYQWLRFIPGVNDINITGAGSLTIQYRYPMKIGDAAVNISDVVSDCEGGV